MQDKPTAIELLEALDAFLREEVAPHVEGGLRFKVLVARNVAGIVAREIALAEGHDRAELERLQALLGKSRTEPAERGDLASRVRELSFELCDRIDAGDADDGPWRRVVLEHVRGCVKEKLAIDNPKIR